jgi:hypothetical protein
VLEDEGLEGGRDEQQYGEEQADYEVLVFVFDEVYD